MDAAIYCRISEDREGAGLGVERQRADCQALISRHGWNLVRVYVDNDISAYSGKKRPEYRRLLDDLQAGRVAAIVAWHTDRLHRSPRELEEFIEICETHKVRVETVRAGELDLKTPAGRAVARTLGAWARYESEHKSERIRRKMVEIAQSGRPHAGGSRCFGYARDGLSIIPEEATVVREAAERVLAGESLRAVCNDLNRRGVRTTVGGGVSARNLRKILLSPRIAGIIDHHTAGRLRGQWPGIITEELRARLVALLNDPARRMNRGAPRRWLLSGTLRCAECGTKLVHQGYPINDRHQRRAQYRCRPEEIRGCGKVSISQHLIEPYLVEAVLSRLDGVRVDAGSSDADDQHDIDALATDRAQLDELASLYAKRTITAHEWIRARAEIDDRIAQRNRRLAEHTVDHRLRDLLARGATIRQAWPNLPAEQQRSIIGTLLERVNVHRAEKGRAFNPGRLEPVWRA
jgi:DNA invertase Pin-like site-specific DNA recombinase